MPRGVYDHHKIRGRANETARKDYSEAIASYESGMRIVDVARIQGIRPQVMGKIFKRRDVKIRPDRAENCYQWKGGRKISTDGYVLVYSPEHHRADRNRYVKEHILVVEKAMGKSLSATHPIHHVNFDKQDNRNENLVVCEDTGYHAFLHKRTVLIQERR